MRKAFLVLGLCSLSAMVACSNDMGRDDITNNQQNESRAMNVNDRSGDIYNHNEKENSSKYGYVRHRKQELGQTEAKAQSASIDREKVADMIGEYCMVIPNVDDVSTLVTDEEVLIVYDTDSTNRNETADQVKRMAMSVVPRWYHVYVSDNTGLRSNLANYSNIHSTSENAEYGIHQLIKEMLNSPQGKRMSTGENANGEAQGELNDDIDHDDISEQMKTRSQQKK